MAANAVHGVSIDPEGEQRHGILVVNLREYELPSSTTDFATNVLSFRPQFEEPKSTGSDVAGLDASNQVSSTSWQLDGNPVLDSHSNPLENAVALLSPRVTYVFAESARLENLSRASRVAALNLAVALSEDSLDGTTYVVFSDEPLKDTLSDWRTLMDLSGVLTFDAAELLFAAGGRAYKSDTAGSKPTYAHWDLSGDVPLPRLPRVGRRPHASCSSPSRSNGDDADGVLLWSGPVSIDGRSVDNFDLLHAQPLEGQNLPVFQDGPAILRGVVKSDESFGILTACKTVYELRLTSERSWYQSDTLDQLHMASAMCVHWLRAHAALVFEIDDRNLMCMWRRIAKDGALPAWTCFAYLLPDPKSVDFQALDVLSFRRYGLGLSGPGLIVCPTETLRNLPAVQVSQDRESRAYSMNPLQNPFAAAAANNNTRGEGDGATNLSKSRISGPGGIISQLLDNPRSSAPGAERRLLRRLQRKSVKSAPNARAKDPKQVRKSAVSEGSCGTAYQSIPDAAIKMSVEHRIVSSKVDLEHDDVLSKPGPGTFEKDSDPEAVCSTMVAGTEPPSTLHLEGGQMDVGSAPPPSRETDADEGASPNALAGKTEVRDEPQNVSDALEIGTVGCDVDEAENARMCDTFAESQVERQTSGAEAAPGVACICVENIPASSDKDDKLPGDVEPGRASGQTQARDVRDLDSSSVAPEIPMVLSDPSANASALESPVLTQPTDGLGSAKNIAVPSSMPNVEMSSEVVAASDDVEIEILSVRGKASDAPPKQTAPSSSNMLSPSLRGVASLSAQAIPKAAVLESTTTPVAECIVGSEGDALPLREATLSVSETPKRPRPSAQTRFSILKGLSSGLSKPKACRSTLRAEAPRRLLSAKNPDVVEVCDPSEGTRGTKDRNLVDSVFKKPKAPAGHVLVGRSPSEARAIKSNVPPRRSLGLDSVETRKTRKVPAGEDENQHMAAGFLSSDGRFGTDSVRRIGLARASCAGLRAVKNSADPRLRQSKVVPESGGQESERSGPRRPRSSVDRALESPENPQALAAADALRSHRRMFVATGARPESSVHSGSQGHSLGRHRRTSYATPLSRMHSRSTPNQLPLQDQGSVRRSGVGRTLRDESRRTSRYPSASPETSQVGDIGLDVATNTRNVSGRHTVRAYDTRHVSHNAFSVGCSQGALGWRDVGRVMEARSKAQRALDEGTLGAIPTNLLGIGSEQNSVAIGRGLPGIDACYDARGVPGVDLERSVEQFEGAMEAAGLDASSVVDDIRESSPKRRKLVAAVTREVDMWAQSVQPSDVALRRGHISQPLRQPIANDAVVLPADEVGRIMIEYVSEKKVMTKDQEQWLPALMQTNCENFSLPSSVLLLRDSLKSEMVVDAILRDRKDKKEKDGLYFLLLDWVQKVRENAIALKKRGTVQPGAL